MHAFVLLQRMKNEDLQRVVFSIYENGDYSTKIFNDLNGVSDLRRNKGWCKMIRGTGSWTAVHALFGQSEPLKRLRIKCSKRNESLFEHPICKLLPFILWSSVSSGSYIFFFGQRWRSSLSILCTLVRLISNLLDNFRIVTPFACFTSFLIFLTVPSARKVREWPGGLDSLIEPVPRISLHQR